MRWLALCLLLTSCARPAVWEHHALGIYPAGELNAPTVRVIGVRIRF